MKYKSLVNNFIKKQQKSCLWLFDSIFLLWLWMKQDDGLGWQTTLARPWFPAWVNRTKVPFTKDELNSQVLR
jgi:hypothetical protein